MSTAAELLEREMQSEYTSFKHMAENLAEKAKRIPQIEPILQALIEGGFDPSWVTVWAAECSFRYNNAGSFKKFEKAFEILKEKGLQIENWTTTRSGRDVIYKNKLGEYLIALVVSPSNELCSMVQTGVEMKEVPIYEMRCNEQVEESPAEKEEEVPL